MAKLLIIDDDEAIRGVYRARFEEAGHQVVEACDGIEGFAEACGERPDLILLDIMMPRMDGIELCLRLKQNPATRMIPIVVITAYDRDIEKMHRGRTTIAADGYYYKSWAHEELEVMMGRLLKGQQAA